MIVEPQYAEFIGYSAAFLTTVAFLPQAIQSWRSRDLSGISLSMYSLFTLGVGLWLAASEVAIDSGKCSYFFISFQYIDAEGPNIIAKTPVKG